jgi:hypothetical protein
VVKTSPCTVPTAMEGHGAFNRNSRVQAATVSPAVSTLEQAARMCTLPPESQPIVIADYGCSQGQNSLIPVLAAINVLRERTGSHRQISVAHSDLPEKISHRFSRYYLRTLRATCVSIVQPLHRRLAGRSMSRFCLLQV